MMLWATFDPLTLGLTYVDIEGDELAFALDRLYTIVCS